MNRKIQTLIPVKVPWMISPSVPYLQLHPKSDLEPGYVTFIGFFKCEETEEKASINTVNDPGYFLLSETAKNAEHRLIKVSFTELLQGKMQHAHSEYEVISESNYDWSQVPSSIKSGESIEENVTRVSNAWLDTGNCPDPCMYEVQGSSWLDTLELNSLDLDLAIKLDTHPLNTFVIPCFKIDRTHPTIG